MRYYLQGLDVREGEDGGVLGRGGGGVSGKVAGRERDQSPLSIRSDPTADATAAKREARLEEDFSDDEGDEEEGHEMGFWGSRARRFLGVEDAVDDGEEGSGDEGESSESEEDDAEVGGNGEEDDDEEEEDEDEDELDLVGHR